MKIRFAMLAAACLLSGCTIMRVLKSILAVLVAVFTALVTPAQGMTFIVDKVGLSSSTDFDWYVYGSGEIVDGDADELFKLLQTAYASAGQSQNMYVYLDSPGGSLPEGMKIGQLISRLKADTDVGRRTKAKDGKIIPASGECSSACVWAYLGGRYRFLRAD